VGADFKNPFKDAVIFGDEGHLFFTLPALIVGGTADAGIKKVREWQAQGSAGDRRIEFEKRSGSYVYKK
jgi:hypothetical protein